MSVFPHKIDLSPFTEPEYIEALLPFSTDQKIMKWVGKGNLWSQTYLEDLLKFSILDWNKSSNERDYYNWVILDSIGEDDYLIGFIQLRRIKKSKELYIRIFLDPQFQGVGSAHQAIDIALNELNNLDPVIKTVFADIDPANIKSTKLFRRVGFAYTKEVQFGKNSKILHRYSIAVNKSERVYPNITLKNIWSEMEAGLVFPYHYYFIPKLSTLLQRASEEKINTKIDTNGNIILSRNFPEDVDNISDYFSESKRIWAITKGKQSMAAAWKDSNRKQEIVTRFGKQFQIYKNKPALVDKKNQLPARALYEALYSTTPVPNHFNPILGRFIIQHLLGKLDGKCILDPSAGWGDRAISAYISGATCYHAYDPNLRMIPTYRNILNKLGKNKDYVIDPNTFENSIISDKYDLVLTSPPYFDLEIYDSDILVESNYNLWIERFLTPYLVNAWSALKSGGYMVIYIENTKFPLATDTKKIVDSLHGSKYQYKISLSVIYDRPGKLRPAWIWKKLN
jgi:RimJ/RimL family protein N-acetyltransferase/16S rRNA G966 N2-methylase RsmD